MKNYNDDQLLDFINDNIGSYPYLKTLQTNLYKMMELAPHTLAYSIAEDTVEGAAEFAFKAAQMNGDNEVTQALIDSGRIDRENAMQISPRRDASVFATNNALRIQHQHSRFTSQSKAVVFASVIEKGAKLSSMFSKVVNEDVEMEKTPNQIKQKSKKGMTISATSPFAKSVDKCKKASGGYITDKSVIEIVCSLSSLDIPAEIFQRIACFTFAYKNKLPPVTFYNASVFTPLESTQSAEVTELNVKSKVVANALNYMLQLEKECNMSF